MGLSGGLLEVAKFFGIPFEESTDGLKGNAADNRDDPNESNMNIGATLQETDSTLEAITQYILMFILEYVYNCLIWMVVVFLLLLIYQYGPVD